MSFLLDTNVVSELRKARSGKAHPSVTEWASSVPAGSLYLSVITLLELEMGVLQVERRDAAHGTIMSVNNSRFCHGLLKFGTEAHGAPLAFLVGRYVFRPSAARLASRWPLFAALNVAVRGGGLRLVFLVRLSPVLPGSLLNYAFGASRVRRRDFVGGTALGIVPVTALYAYLGSLATGVADLSSGRASEAGKAGRVLYWAGLLVTALAALLVTRAARRVLARTLAERTKGRAPGREPG